MSKFRKKKLGGSDQINTSALPDIIFVQANDVLISSPEIVQWVNQERDKLPEADRGSITISMKVDKEVKMGPISDVQTELRNADARKVLYASTKKLDQE